VAPNSGTWVLLAEETAEPTFDRTEAEAGTRPSCSRRVVSGSSVSGHYCMATLTGTLLAVDVASPSWPEVLSPQQ
jgi:hypothetical protein